MQRATGMIFSDRVSNSGEISASLTVITAVMNRTEQLRTALPTWLAHPQIDHVIIVDWNSDTPVVDELDLSASDTVRVIRVEKEPYWHLTAAFNTALRLVQTQQVLKLDADYHLRARFFQLNTLRASEYLTGDWRSSRIGQSGLNGLLWAWTDDLLAVGGWDERIDGYGWDDSDLAERLSAVGLHRVTVHRGSATHRFHSNRERVRNRPAEFPLPPKLSTQVNRIRTQARHPWIGPNLHFGHAYSLFGVATEESELDRWIKARIVAQDDSRPWRSRLRQLNRQLASPAWVRLHSWIHQVLKIGPQARKYLLVEVKHGLGNRLRVLASAVVIARATQRVLIVAWIPDSHCQAKLTDLIDYRGLVIDSEDSLRAYVHDRRVAIVNYMDDAEPTRKGQQLPMPRRITYVRSSSVLRHRVVNYEKISRVARSWSPVIAVTQKLNDIRVIPDIGLHVRSGHIPGGKQPSFESYLGNWSQAADEKIRLARQTTGAAAFQEVLAEMVSGDREYNGCVLVCADSPVARHEMEAWLIARGALQVVPGADGSDRSRESVIVAFAEAIALSRSGLFVGSSYSAFSDLVIALRGSAAPHTIVGSQAR